MVSGRRRRRELRARVMEKFGLDYERLRATNPRIIVARIKASASPPVQRVQELRHDRPGDGRIMSVTGFEDREPIRCGAAIATPAPGPHGRRDHGAYIQRQRTGQGQLVEVAMQEPSPTSCVAASSTTIVRASRARAAVTAWSAACRAAPIRARRAVE